MAIAQKRSSYMKNKNLFIVLMTAVALLFTLGLTSCGDPIDDDPVFADLIGDWSDYDENAEWTLTIGNYLNLKGNVLNAANNPKEFNLTQIVAEEPFTSGSYFVFKVNGTVSTNTMRSAASSFTYIPSKTSGSDSIYIYYDQANDSIQFGDASGTSEVETSYNGIKYYRK
jgi:hypothetical protein